MTDQPEQIPRSKRRWFQYRLRSLFIAIGLCAVAARLVANPILEAKRQARAAEAIHSSGGQIYTCQGEPIIPDWMRRFYTPDLDATVSHVELADESGDAELSLVRDFSDLRNLMQCGHRVTDTGLGSIVDLTNLRSLNLSYSQVSDDGLRNLSTLVRLERLDMSATKITDVGLRALRPLVNLASLSLSDTAISDDSLQELKALKNLRQLDLDGTRVTPEGIRRLQLALPHCNDVRGP